VPCLNIIFFLSLSNFFFLINNVPMSQSIVDRSKTLPLSSGNEWGSVTQFICSVPVEVRLRFKLPQNLMRCFVLITFSLRWRGGRESGQLWLISLVESLNNKLQSLNHAFYQRGDYPSTVKKARQTLRNGYATASKGRPLQNSSSSKSFAHYAVRINI
jgi:hypothetical protein